ncbi:MAG TPA: alpha/beta hydrolase [Acidobacteriota bacterium]|jgi:acetyl esterase/lipase|nr:alpha/beta hydrolase [Acidobacteriota bacterium]HRV08841.1 alpha/beta hydrolase [Acidobacteriota bacterium]
MRALLKGHIVVAWCSLWIPGPAWCLQTEGTQIPEGTVVHRDLDYVGDGHPRHMLDLYVPPGVETPPLIIWIHGGAWLAGDKANPRPLPYLNKGYAVASINYRLSRHAVFPAQIVDCKTAVRWLRANAARFGYDAERFAVWGESAGGHLAALLGTTGDTSVFEPLDGFEVTSRVQAVVDFFGPTDLLQMDDRRLPDGMVHNAPDSPESKLVGGPLQENREKAESANPVRYVSPEDPPFLIVHGDSDPLVPHHQSELLAAALEAAGVPVTFYTVKGAGHGGFRDPTVAALVEEFLARYLGTPAVTR